MAGQALVAIKDKQWAVDIAITHWELSQGLGGLPELPLETGMLFDLGFEQTIQVTTVPMLFSLDIAFLSDELMVTEVYHNIEPGYLVTTTQPAHYFIEVNAGELEGIAPGDTVSVDLLPFEEISVAPDWLSITFGLAGFLMLGTLTVSVARDFTGKALEETEEKPVLLPQVSPGQSTGSYQLEMDRIGNIIITRLDDHGKDVLLQFESDKALVYDLLKKVEKRDMDAGWKVKIKQSEPRASVLDELWESSAQPQRLPSTAKKPARHDVKVETWQERDRIGIWITDRRTDKVIAEWWDEDALEMFEQGFFKPGVPQRTTEKPSRAFVDSVLAYAESVGLIAGGKYLAQTVRDAYYWTALSNNTGEIAESYTPYTSSGRALRGGKAFISRHWQGLALVEVWKQPGRYSEGLRIEPVASERLTLKKVPAAITTEGKLTGTCYADAWRFLIKEGEGKLIHGTVFSGGRRMGHAWVETSTGWVWEPETGRYFTLLGFRDTFAPDVESRYTAEEAAIMAARTKHLGPWTKQQRRQYLKDKSPAAISEQPRQSRQKSRLEFLPDSPEFLAYTIDDIGYRDRIDSAFLSAIARAGGKRQ
jgi:uncharacterized membrane protein (UPF0127 family)